MKAFGRRRKFLIDRLQITLLGINLLYMLAMVLVFVIVLFGPVIVTALGKSTNVEKKIEAADRMLLLHSTVWPAVFILALLFGFHSVIYTHRIAGPLYRFRRVLRAVGRGDLRVRSGVRDKDYLRTESDVINEMIEGLILRVRDVRNRFDAAREASHEVAQAPPFGDAAERTAAIERLTGRIEKTAAAIEGFQLPEGLTTESVARAREARSEAGCTS